MTSMKTAPSVFSTARKKRAVRAAQVACVCVVCLLSGCASRSQFQKGYDRGAADAVKRQYWILQNMQKGEDAEPRHRTRIYRLPVQPDPNATVKTVPYEIAIAIVE